MVSRTVTLICQKLLGICLNCELRTSPQFLHIVYITKDSFVDHGLGEMQTKRENFVRKREVFVRAHTQR